MGYWSNFAAAADPNAPPDVEGSGTARPRSSTLTAWPRFLASSGAGNRTWPTQMLWTEGDGGVGPVAELHAQECAFWAALWQREGSGAYL